MKARTRNSFYIHPDTGIKIYRVKAGTYEVERMTSLGTFSSVRMALQAALAHYIGEPHD